MHTSPHSSDRELHTDLARRLRPFLPNEGKQPRLVPYLSRIGAVALMVAVVSCYANAQGLPPLARNTVGSEFQYAVKPGDTLLSIGARRGIERKTLAYMNGLGANASVPPGQVLRIDNRHIAPADLENGILINLPQRKLFLLRSGAVEANFPVGAGKAVFASPIGGFSVVQMRENPTWYVPKSIQDESARAGKAVKKTVPPGPNNPLGGYWIGLSFSSYGIHGTNKPYRFTTFRVGAVFECILRTLAPCSGR